MAAYMIVLIDVTDADAYEPYKAPAAATIAQYGGRYLARGGTRHVLEGDLDPERVVILEFPTMERLQEWYNSPEYNEVKGIRIAATDSAMIAVEGLSRG